MSDLTSSGRMGPKEVAKATTVECGWSLSELRDDSLGWLRRRRRSSGLPHRVHVRVSTSTGTKLPVSKASTASSVVCLASVHR